MQCVVILSVDYISSKDLSYLGSVGFTFLILSIPPLTFLLSVPFVVRGVTRVFLFFPRARLVLYDHGVHQLVDASWTPTVRNTGLGPSFLVPLLVYSLGVASILCMSLM